LSSILNVITFYLLTETLTQGMC